MTVKQNLSILIWANPSKKDKNGLLPVYARITIDGKRAEISLGKKVCASKWDKDSSQVIGKDTETKALNNHFIKVKADINTLFLNLCAQHQQVNPQMLSNAYTGKEVKKKEKTLIDTFEYHNQKFKEKATNGMFSLKTYQRFEILKNKVVTFMNSSLGKKDIELSVIKRQFVTEFEHFLMIKQKMSSNTAMKYIKMLKKIINVAVANEWLPVNPFNSFKCTYTNPTREVLTQHELEVIWNKQMPNQRLEQVRDIFMFACYTGYAFSDIENFNRDVVSVGIDGEQWIKTNRIKTDSAENVMLLDIPLAIIDKYRNHHYCLAHNKLLPVISNQRYNSYLKEISDICNINKHITSHIARHTFATTVTLANGISLESVSAMLGHKNIRTTQIYAKVVQSKLSNEMKGLKQKLSSVQNTLLLQSSQ